MTSLLQDLRLATRRLRKSPGFTITALVVLALGIGATATLFSAVKAVLLDPLPYPDSERIYLLRQTQQPEGEVVQLSYPTFVDFKSESQSWAALGAFRFANFNLTGALEPAQVRVARVSEQYFDVFSLEPSVGRTFTPEENGATSQDVVVIGHNLWQHQLGGRQEVIGETLFLDRQAYTIVGVMRPELEYPSYADLWMPLGDLSERRRDQRELTVVGRLAADVPPETATAETQTLAARLANNHPESRENLDITIRSLMEELVGDSRTTLLALFAAVGGVLLIACLNVATLQTARGLDRRREVAVRTAFGADRSRVVRELMTESLVLAISGGALGVMLTSWSLELLVAYAPDTIPRLELARIDWTVLGFAFLLSAVTGVLFGLAPALQSTRFDIVEALKKGRTDIRDARTGLSLRARLVVAQVALTFVLLVGAGLLLRSFHELWSIDPGFEVDQAVSLGLVMPPDLYPEGHQRSGFIRDVSQKIRELPKAANASAVNYLPFNFAGTPTPIEIVGTSGDTTEAAQAPVRIVATGYFDTLRIPVRQGRTFQDSDDASAPAVTVVNESFAERYWPGRSAIGQTFRMPRRGRDPLTVTVIGVASNLKHGGLTAAVGPALYRPHAQEPWNYMNLVVRAEQGPPELLIPDVQKIVWELDPDRPLFAVGPLASRLEYQLARPRFSALLTGAFSILALVLAAVGLYSVLAFSVNQRALELGVRLALGAQRRRLRNMVVGQGMTLVAIGLGLGFLASLAVSRLLESLLFVVGTRDLTTYITVPTVLLFASYLAAYLPAMRASRVDPVAVLREQ